MFARVASKTSMIVTAAFSKSMLTHYLKTHSFEDAPGELDALLAWRLVNPCLLAFVADKLSVGNHRTMNT